MSGRVTRDCIWEKRMNIGWGYKISIRGLKKERIRMSKKRNYNIKNLKCYFVCILFIYELNNIPFIKNKI